MENMIVIAVLEYRLSAAQSSRYFRINFVAFQPSLLYQNENKEKVKIESIFSDKMSLITATKILINK